MNVVKNSSLICLYYDTYCLNIMSIIAALHIYLLKIDLRLMSSVSVGCDVQHTIIFHQIIGMLMLPKLKLSTSRGPTQFSSVQCASQQSDTPH
jgi:hypothetical protein